MRWPVAAWGISMVAFGAPAPASDELSLSTGFNKIQQNNVALAFAL